MFRAGTSWPGRNGRRYWVSGPLWMWPLAQLGGTMFWLCIGWWLMFAWWGLLIVGWFAAQALALLLSLFAAGAAAYEHYAHGTNYEPRPVTWHGITAVTWKAR
jgi:hypothetical protein